METQPMAQDFFAAFGHDAIGQVGNDTTICSGDLAGICLIAIQALEKRTDELASLKLRLDALMEENARLRKAGEAMTVTREGE